MLTPLQLLYRRGFRGEVLAHVMPWFKKTADKAHYHPMLEYNSSDPALISRQADLMQASDIKGVLITYQGHLSEYQHSTTMNWNAECNRRGMKFGLVMDPWAAKLGGGKPTANMQAVFNNADVKAMLASPSYLPEGYVLDFNTGADFNQVYLPPVNGLRRPVLSFWTGFSWIKADGSDPIAALKKNNNLPTQKIPGLSVNFFDGGLPPGGNTPEPISGGKLDFSLCNWGAGQGPARYTPDRAGNYFFDQLDPAVTPLQNFRYVALITWNDYNERTGPWETWLSIFNDQRISS